jgi:predicted GNAT superfamily acetyltransferase
VANDQITIELVHDAAGVNVALDVSRQIWGPGSAVDSDAYIAVVRHGGYMAVARDGNTPVGASFGFVTDRGLGLHSHFTGVVATHAGSGLGQRLKQFQRAWAAEQGIDHITWTFDPLMRRNAWFNLLRLGAQVIGYHQNYYGEMDDAINGGDETDRLEVWWPVASATANEPLAADDLIDRVIIPTPADIEAVRSADIAEALRWRRQLRADLGGPLATGGRVVGLTADGSYVVELP